MSDYDYLFNESVQFVGVEIIAWSPIRGQIRLFKWAYDGQAVETIINWALAEFKKKSIQFESVKLEPQELDDIPF